MTLSLLTTEERIKRFIALWEMAARLNVAENHVVRDVELARLPIEKKLEMVRRLVDISRQAGRLPDWYERLMAKP
ncbi:MAG: hypothetical protein NT025_09975 [bacterium]|nr:hypothetical protein [bacterium]